MLHLLQQVLAEYEDLSKVEVGPAPPPAEGESIAAVSERLSDAVRAFMEAPFTIQRLCELLLQPRKQYSRLDKLVLSHLTSNPCACCKAMHPWHDFKCCLRKRSCHAGAGSGEAAAGDIDCGAHARAAARAYFGRAGPCEREPQAAAHRGRAGCGGTAAREWAQP